MKKRFALILAAVIALTALLIIPASAASWNKRCPCNDYFYAGHTLEVCEATQSSLATTSAEHVSSLLGQNLVGHINVSSEGVYIENGNAVYGSGIVSSESGTPSRMCSNFDAPSGCELVYVESAHTVGTQCFGQVYSYAYHDRWGDTSYSR